LPPLTKPYFCHHNNYTTLNQVLILDYEPQLAPYFKKINAAWIEHYFKLEEHDLHQLETPEESILKPGGAILFARYENEIAGTCALIKTGETEFELAKMGVDKQYRSKQIGKALLVAAIEKAKTLGAKKLWLGSSTKLQPALRLYEQFGFQHVPLQPSPYARADIRMELNLV
jgi:GNAT superfamily N-acetyltransferase